MIIPVNGIVISANGMIIPVNGIVISANDNKIFTAKTQRTQRFIFHSLRTLRLCGINLNSYMRERGDYGWKLYSKK